MDYSNLRLGLNTSTFQVLNRDLRNHDKNRLMLVTLSLPHEMAAWAMG